MDISAVWDKIVFSLSDDTTITVGRIVGAVGIFIGGWIISLLVSRFLVWKFSNSRLSKDSELVARKVILFLMVIFVFLAALNYLQVPLHTFTFISGAIAIGVGFGAQNIINNFISGWILISERPVRIGDFVEIDNATGTVNHIGNRSTQIRRVDGVHILVPNSMMLERVLINWTLTDRNIRTMVSVGVAYGSPVRKVESLIHEAVGQHSEILAVPKPSVIFESFGDNALIFETYFWCTVTGERDLRKVRSDVRFRISELFEDNGVVIAFPQRDVHVNSVTPIQVEVVKSDVKNDQHN